MLWRKQAKISPKIRLQIAEIAVCQIKKTASIPSILKHSVLSKSSKMTVKNQKLYKSIDEICRKFEKEFDQINPTRKSLLMQLSQYISSKIKENQAPKITVICTHNSRRSHIAQLWLAVAADYFQMPAIGTFSGGTEATAFNSRAVRALQNIGFEILTQTEKDNPLYQVSWKKNQQPYLAFSKKYDESPNPTEKFAAIMVCSEADAECPTVFGCDFRLALPFDDPKEFDETPLETAKYDERVRQIGREMLFVMSQVS